MVKRERKGGEEDKGDGTYVFMRAEDRSIWMRMSYLLDKYKPLVWTIGLLLAAAGFGFETPKKIFGSIKVTQDSLSKRVTRLEQLALNLDALIRVKCVELKDKPEALELAGINCRRWLSPNSGAMVSPQPTGRP